MVKERATIMIEVVNQNKTYKLGIVGSPLAHSRSPQMQMAGLAYLGLDGDYKKFEIQESSFDGNFTTLLSEIDGLNITIPYKEKVFKYINHMDPLAEQIGAVNTIVIEDGKTTGYNTDYYGFLKSIEHLDLKGKKVATLGAGGAAKAVLLALEHAGVTEIDIFVRSMKKAYEKLPHGDGVRFNIRLLDEIDNDDHSLDGVSMLINCTPIGQGRLKREIPIKIDHLNELEPGATVYDLVYSDTVFLQRARDLGFNTIDGTEMLILQGVKSLSLWTGKEIDEDLIQAMRVGFGK